MIEVTLVGFKYHVSQSYIDSISEGDRFLLKRDENNEYDPLAVGVYDDGGLLIGYVQKHDAHLIWKALTYPIYCTITDIGTSHMTASINVDAKETDKEFRVIPPYESAVVEPYTRDNIIALAETTRAMTEFAQSLLNNSDTREMLESSLHNSADDAASLDMVLKYVLGADISIVYKRLGHRLGQGKPEALGASLFAYMIGDPKSDVDLSLGWQFWVKSMEPAAVALIKECDGVFAYDPPMDFEFFIQALLANMEDEQWMTRYMVLMYRFASLIAKADGKITKKEAAWLAKLMQKPEIPVEEASDDPSVTESESKTDDKAMNDLMGLVGLTEVKDEIARLRSLIQIQNRRKEEGLAVIPVSRHFVFTGNPGTGKTTVARILAEIYRDLGVVKGGQLIETDRSGLVAEYVGQTAIKTNKVIDSAMDGVLFIDEAYSLVQGGKEDFGSEAIATLLKRMEDNRDRLVVILAGYNDEMQAFIDSNPGLQSRFNRYINFPDYDAEELLEIFEMLLKKNDFVLTDEAKRTALAKFENAIANKTKNFGNARYVRNVFERTLENQAVRLSAQPRISHKELITIESVDL